MTNLKKIKNAISFFWNKVNNKKAQCLLYLYCLFYDKKPALKFNSESIKSVAMYQWNDRLGDAVMAGVFIGLLRKHRPDIKITVITGTFSRAWYQAISDVEVITLGNKIKMTRTEAKFFRKYKGLFDVVVDVGRLFKHMEIFAMYNLGAKHYIGYNKEKYKLFDLKIDKKHMHFYDRNIAAAAFLGAVETNPSFPTPAFHDHLKNFKPFIDNLPQGKNKVSVNFFGSEKYRQFNLITAKQFLTQWCETFPEDILMLIPVPGREDFIAALHQEMNQRIDRSGQIITFPVVPSIANTLALLKLSDFCFTPDTSVVHMASAIDVPVLAIYKNEEISFSEWKPVNPNSQALFSRKPLFKKEKVYIHEFDWNEFKAAREKILSVRHSVIARSEATKPPRSQSRGKSSTAMIEALQ